MIKHLSKIGRFNKLYLLLFVLFGLLIWQTSYQSFCIKIDADLLSKKRMVVDGKSSIEVHKDGALNMVIQKNAELLFNYFPPFVAASTWSDFPYIILNMAPSDDPKNFMLRWLVAYNQVFEMSVEVSPFESAVLLKADPAWLAQKDKIIRNVSLFFKEESKINPLSICFQSGLTLMQRLRHGVFY